MRREIGGGVGGGSREGGRCMVLAERGLGFRREESEEGDLRRRREEFWLFGWPWRKKE